MATAVEMGEVDEIHTREDSIKDGVVTNGEISTKSDLNDSASKSDNLEDEEDKNQEILSSSEIMEVDSDDESDQQINKNGVDKADEEDEDDDLEEDGIEEDIDDEELLIKQSVEIDDDDDDDGEIEDDDEDEDDAKEVVEEIEDEEEEEEDEDVELAELKQDDDEDEDDVSAGKDLIVCTDSEGKEAPSEPEKEDDKHDSASTIELNDSGEADVVIIDNDAPKENGQAHVTKDVDDDNETTVISDDGEDAPPPSLSTTSVPVKAKKLSLGSPRRSARKRNKRSYVESDKDSESDIEEIVPEDPLAIQNELSAKRRLPSATIVVKDTKRLVEIAAKSSPGNAGKKEPTLVIIDTNSILSGRGPVPLAQKPSLYAPLLPAAVPAQGVYPPNMRATITPIPMNNPPSGSSSKAHGSSSSSHHHHQHHQHQQQQQQPILPSLTDDMFVVEAPSFIVPYVYEKPPIKDFKQFLVELGKEVAAQKKLEAEAEAEAEAKAKAEKAESDEEDDKSDAEPEKEKKVEQQQQPLLPEKPSFVDEERRSYFENPLCKFFIDIGNNLVQEYVQTDLLKQQRRKRDREQGQNSQTNSTIKSLLKSLEYSKENNEPYRVEMKKCEFCSFKTESSLAMAFHLETPHMKNYVYKCNFCPFEVRSPHDILFHMEAEHAIRGRLERAPAFHQCPNCPFEDNQKGKLSRHLVACTRKFRPEKNLEPPLDWEPPAKIPRAPRMKQTLGKTAALYQMAKQSSLYELVPKMQAGGALSRGRGRPSMGAGKAMIRPNPAMIYKHSMSGGSVLVPTNYQMSGNHIYQVVGGHDLGGRISSGSPMALNLTAAIQQQQSSSNKKTMNQPSISITPLPRGSSSSNSCPPQQSKPGDSNSKNSFVICEICDGYIKDLEQLRNHMQWIHKVKIHPKMIYNRPPLNCQKCQFRFFTDQGLERHLLGSHGLVTSSMQDAANKSKDSGRCPVCGRVYQWKLLNHVARDHGMTLKPAHLSYKCTVCTATFGMYKLFENHVYSAHSVVAKRVMDKKTSSSTSGAVNAKSETLLKPLKINDEITIIPQQPKMSAAGPSKESSPSSTATSGSKSGPIGGPSTSKNLVEEANSALSRAERLARRKSAVDI